MRFSDGFGIMCAVLQDITKTNKEKRTMARKVDEAKCVGCGACAGACPAEAITIGDKAAIDAAKCVDCGACEGACPAEAISAQ